MQDSKKAIVIATLIWAVLVLVASAQTERQMGMEKGLSAWELLRKDRAKGAKAAESPAKESKRTHPQSKERVVHFPAARSLGRLMIQDENTERYIDTFFYWTTKQGTDWQFLSQATGDVTVPAGKRLALYVSQDGWKDLSGLSGLAPDDLHTLSIYGPYEGGQLPDDRVMPHVAHLTGLKVLYLGYADISARGTACLKDLKALERLAMSKRTTDKTLAEIAELPWLKGLYLRGNRLTNAGLAHLQKLTALEELALGQGRMTDAGLAHVAKLPSLRYLLLTGKNFNDAGMSHLKDSSTLKTLHLGHLTQLTDAALVYISGIANLERLTLHWNENITDAGIAHLKKLRSLKMLDIGHSQATVRGIACLSEIKSLEYLDPPGKIINDQALEYLAELRNLKHLSVARPHYVDPKMDKDYYTDRGLRALSRLSLLEDLSIGSIGITDEGMSDIAKLTNLRELSIFGGRIGNSGLGKLLGLKSIERLSLAYTETTISGLAQLRALPNLTYLTVRQIDRGQGLLDLCGLSKLKQLSISLSKPSSFSDADLMSLANLKNLEWLQIGPRQYTADGLAHLAGLTQMERLGIGGPELTDDALRHLANMKKLNHLTISDGNITDSGLRHLEGLEALGYLIITTRGRISAAGKRLLRQKLPSLGYFQVQPKKDAPGPPKSKSRGRR